MIFVALVFFISFLWIYRLATSQKITVEKILLYLNDSFFLFIFSYWLGVRIGNFPSNKLLSPLSLFFTLKSPFWIAFLLGLLFCGGTYLYEKKFAFSPMPQKIGVYIRWLFISLILFIALLLSVSSFWAVHHFGDLSMDQLVFHLKEPITGSENSQIIDFIFEALFPTLMLWHVLNFILLISWEQLLAPTSLKLSSTTRRGYLKIKFQRRMMSIAACVLVLFGSVAFSLHQFGYKEVKAYFFESTKLYEEHYVDPQKVQLTFPEKKRNLIYIFLESVESTYLSKDLGGAQEVNLMPHLTELSQQEGSYHFSNTDNFGGAKQLPGTGFTIGGILAQTAGIPLTIPIDHNEYGKTGAFMPGAYSLGDVLNKAGYNQTFIMGSEGNFAGRDQYFTQHGNYKVEDLLSARKKGLIPEDYKVWWGYEDEKLFTFAKDEILELAQKEEPFNFGMLTVDTHFPDGYLEKDNPQVFDNQYASVIHFSDELLSQFMQWIQEQEFYENTTVVISGDHLSMDGNFFKELPEDYIRTVANVILNPLLPKDQNFQLTNRQYSTLDFYPTTLAALGVEIKGNKMGLGTNLFSEEKTLMEKLGYENLKNELSKKSNYYNQKMLKEIITEDSSSKEKGE